MKVQELLLNSYDFLLLWNNYTQNNYRARYCSGFFFYNIYDTCTNLVTYFMKIAEIAVPQNTTISSSLVGSQTFSVKDGWTWSIQSLHYIYFDEIFCLWKNSVLFWLLDQIWLDLKTIFRKEFFSIWFLMFKKESISLW